jgi:hypothetical protein
MRATLQSSSGRIVEIITGHGKEGLGRPRKKSVSGRIDSIAVSSEGDLSTAQNYEQTRCEIGD